MNLERVDPAELARPSGFSHAVRVPAGAELIFLAGQTALDADGRIVASSVVEQFERALRNLLTALRAAGGRPDRLAGVTVYIVDLDDYREHAKQIGAVWRALVGEHYPAMAAVGVSRLWDSDALVELQGVAALPAPQ